jgi:hypothetical protein
LPRSRFIPVFFAIVLLAVAACSKGGGGSRTPDAAPTAQVPPSPTTPPSVPLSTTVTNVAGDMTDQVKDKVRQEAGAAIDSYLTKAFLAGPAGAAEAFARFTPAAAAQAVTMTEALTSGSLAPALTVVRATHYQAGLSVWAYDGLPQGATAQVDLILQAEHPTQGPLDIVVNGTLDMAPTPEGWRIFGYTVTNTVAEHKVAPSTTVTNTASSRT